MEFIGINAPFIEQYITFKRNLGYAFKDTHKLRIFDRFTVENVSKTIGMTKALAEKWAEKRPNESEVTRYKRVGEVIKFLKYLHHLGYDSYIPRQIKSHRSTFIPYIFSHEELKAFFAAADTHYVHRTSNMKYIIPIIFRVIYGCGLRANEALSLKCGDVHLVDKYIVIREPKNGHDRMLPISGSLADICALYKKRYLKKHVKEDYFFTQKVTV